MDPQQLRARLRGVAITPVVPMSDDGQVDVEGIGELTRFLVGHGLSDDTGVLIPLSGTGEFMSLSDAEHEAVLAATIEAADGAVTVVAGANHMDTRGAIQRARRAQALGAAGVMVGPPFYFRPTNAEILDHYRRICDALEIGVVLYNNCFATQVDLAVELLDELADLPNVVGMKESTPSAEKLLRVLRVVGDRIAVLSGYGEAREPQARLWGSPGFVSPMATVVPELSLELECRLRARDYEGAAAHARRIATLRDYLCGGEGGTYVGALKAGLTLRGLRGGSPRPPFQPLPAQQVRAIAAELECLGIETPVR